VFAEGFGTYVSQWGHVWNGNQIAHDLAMQQYHRVAQSAFASAACPACGKFSPVAMARAEHDGARRMEAAESRLWWALGVAAAIGVLALGGALYDGSGWLAVGAACAAVAVGLVTFYMRTPTGNLVRLVHPNNVVFFWNGQWFSPQASYAPADTPVTRTGLLGGLTLTGAIMLLAGALTGVVMWAGTFQSLLVVNTEPSTLYIQIDGEHAGIVGSTAGSKDAPSTKFHLRPGIHTLEAFSESKELLERKTIEVERFDDDWVFAPRATHNGACMATVLSTYSSGKDAPGPQTTRHPEVAFSANWTSELVRGPTSITLDNNSSQTTRTALRAFDCVSLDEDDEPMGFASRSR